MYSVSIRNYKRCLYDASSYSYRDSNFKQLETAKETHPKGYTLLFFSWFFCCILFLLFGNWIGTILFHSQLAGNFLLTLSWICPFLYANSTLISIINGLGNTTISFLINTFGLFIRIIGVIVFIPQIGLNGYLWGLLASQLSVSILSILYLSCHLKKREFAT